MDNFYVQLIVAILVVLSLIAHKLHWTKTAELADKVKDLAGK